MSVNGQFLLFGFAIENLLKGIYIRRNPSAIDDNKLQIPTHHSLIELAREVGFVPHAAEADLLQKLTTIVEWSGRYPVARTVHKHGAAGLNRDGIFADPVSAGIGVQG